MSRRSFAAIAIGLFCLATTMAGVAPATDDLFAREYVGALGMDHGLNEHWMPICDGVFGTCPHHIPYFFGSAQCADDAPQVGNVAFCAVRFPSEAEIRIRDDHLSGVIGWVYCKAPWGLIYLFTVEGEGGGTIPGYCLPAAGQGETAVVVALHLPPDGAGASRGVVEMRLHP